MRKHIFIILFLLIICSSANAFNAFDQQWLGTYMGQKKIGYLSLNMEKSTYNGLPGYKATSNLLTEFKVLGTDMSQNIKMIMQLDLEFKPYREDFIMSSGGKTTTIMAIFTHSSVECMISAGSGITTKSVSIPAGITLGADSMFGIREDLLKVGSTTILNFFNPLTLSIDSMTINVEKKETAFVGGKKYDTFLVQNKTPLGNMSIWQTKAGEVVRIDAPMNIKMVKESKKIAMTKIDKKNQDDLAELSKIIPNNPIENPRLAKSLTIELIGIKDKNMVINDKRQKAAFLKDSKNNVIYNIDAFNYDASKSLDLPINNAEFKEYLISSPYIDSDNAQILEQTKRIIGDEKNIYKACSLIREWISSNIVFDANIGITRSGLDVLKSKVGVCRDYATLFASMARSVGIPAKTASGLVYAKDGFYSHVWVECYTGNWIPFDATMNNDFVDATHIKLAEGDTVSIFNLAKVIGSLKVRVDDCKY